MRQRFIKSFFVIIAFLTGIYFSIVYSADWVSVSGEVAKENGRYVRDDQFTATQIVPQYLSIILPKFTGDINNNQLVSFEEFDKALYPDKRVNYAKKKTLISSSQGSVWNELGNGWSINIVSVEKTHSLKFSPLNNLFKEESATADGVFLIVTFWAKVEEEAYKKKVILEISRGLTFVIDNEENKFPMKGIFHGNTYIPEIVKQGIRGRAEKIKIPFDVPVKSTGFKLKLTKKAPLINLPDINENS